MLGSSVKHPPITALLISLVALALPVAGAVWIPEVLDDYEALLWLVAVVPAFLFAYYRGWRGAATWLAAGMAILSITYAVTQATGRHVPDLLLPVVVFLILFSLLAGGLAERLHRDAGTALTTSSGFTDTATGLPNRNHAELHLEIEFSAAQRGRPLAVVLLDLDNFKGFNARHGAIAGDEIMRILGEVLKRTTRRMNLTARFGDDEFICVLGGCDDDGAMVFVNRFLDGLRAVSGQRPLPTISGGVASYGPSMQTHHALMEAAESALKQAKKEGRGRIRIHGRAINLPLDIRAEVEDEAPAPEADVQPKALMPQGRGRGRKSLIVAEDGALRALLARFLTDHGFTVAQVSNVVDGVQCLTIEYDLLFTDISLTEGFGAELVRAAKLRWPSIQVLGIVQHHEGDLLIETLNAGVDRYLMTPLDLPKVRQHITELLARRDRLVTSLLESRQMTAEFQARTQDAVDALKQSQEEYQSVVSSLHEVIFRTNTQGAFTFLNSAWQEATGLPMEDTIGKVAADFVHEEDRVEFTGAMSSLLSGDRADARGELRILTSTGDVRWFELRMRKMYDADSRLSGVTGTLDDVTARKDAEDALRDSEQASRALLAALPDEVLRVNKEGIILAYEGTHDSGREIVGGSIEQIFPSGVSDALRDRIKEVMNNEAVDVYEYRLLEGEDLQEFEVRLAPSGANEIVIIVRNVTDKKLLEEQLRQSQKLEAIGRLAGGLAHDFNNLLTVMQGNAQMLGDESMPDSARDYVDQIKHAAERGASLVKQLLAFGRRQVMQPTILNLNAVVENTRGMLARLIGENILLNVDLDPALGLVKVDPGQIEQVLVNLAVNARDAMRQGGHLRIMTRNAVMAANSDDPGDTERVILLTISDDGAGMDEETRERIFEPFFTTKSFAQSSGLGLASVYGIVRQSGGTIYVSSEPGMGSTFEIAIPRVDEE
ncbi:MAG TPA: diguanylate cyclase [Longimicrobiales bacterium]|nr:diguanylate cyclase [Longimicrobiales bacterium]